MQATRRKRRSYDPRLRRLVHQNGGDELARRFKVPDSTIRSWRRAPPPTVVAEDALDLGSAELQAVIAKLERRIAALNAIMTLRLALIRVRHGRLDHTRLPSGTDKATILRAVQRTRSVLTLRSALRVIGLSASRYTAWRQAGECEFDDAVACPQKHPTRLTPEEVRLMRDMATAPEYRHVATSTLAMLAQRLGRVFAAPATWCRYVRDRGWRRPRKRVHPSAPKVGVRATKPDEMWHVDTTVIRLLDGRKVYLRAVIDNFSRRILSWWLGASPEPTATAALLIEAADGRTAAASQQSVMVDGGVENFNGAVDKLVNDGILKRILAQTDIAASNSVIEAFFRIAKHGWLFLNDLDTLSTVRRLVEFYVTEHNSKLPHSALHGRTPDEVYFGRGTDVPDRLAQARATAREERYEANRTRRCNACRAS